MMCGPGHVVVKETLASSIRHSALGIQPDELLIFTGKTNSERLNAEN
jgi:hypothetical protein